MTVGPHIVFCATYQLFLSEVLSSFSPFWVYLSYYHTVKIKTSMLP